MLLNNFCAWTRGKYQGFFLFNLSLFTKDRFSLRSSFMVHRVSKGFRSRDGEISSLFYNFSFSFVQIRIIVISEPVEALADLLRVVFWVGISVFEIVQIREGFPPGFISKITRLKLTHRPKSGINYFFFKLNLSTLVTLLKIFLSLSMLSGLS